ERGDLIALCCIRGLLIFFFFQAEDGIRDLIVTGVQTCALPISFSCLSACAAHAVGPDHQPRGTGAQAGKGGTPGIEGLHESARRSEERRVGKECRYRWETEH